MDKFYCKPIGLILQTKNINAVPFRLIHYQTIRVEKRPDIIYVSRGTHKCFLQFNISRF